MVGSNSSFVIISRVPERISRICAALRPWSSDGQYFSEVESFIQNPADAHLQIIIVDDVQATTDLSDQVRILRQSRALDAAAIIAVVADSERDRGIAAMDHGANDFVSYSLVDRELLVRVRMHANSPVGAHRDGNLGGLLDEIHPLEDRVILQNCLWHIDHHLGRIKTVNDLVLAAGRSERDINRAFTEHLSQTPSQYLRMTRIGKAKELLRQTRMPIIQIADTLGYSSAANFATAFKSIVGASPREFRHLKQ